jgi:hypothetical protein
LILVASNLSKEKEDKLCAAFAGKYSTGNELGFTRE